MEMRRVYNKLGPGVQQKLLSETALQNSLYGNTNIRKPVHYEPRLYFKIHQGHAVA
jgi:hypothetical protein